MQQGKTSHEVLHELKMLLRDNPDPVPHALKLLKTYYQQGYTLGFGDAHGADYRKHAAEFAEEDH